MRLPVLVCCAQIDLRRNEIGAEGAKLLADALRVNASITSIGEGGLDLCGNGIGGAGCAAIIAAVCSNKESKVHSIDFPSYGIGPDDAKVIGEALHSRRATAKHECEDGEYG